MAVHHSVHRHHFPFSVGAGLAGAFHYTNLQFSIFCLSPLEEVDNEQKGRCAVPLPSRGMAKDPTPAPPLEGRGDAH